MSRCFPFPPPGYEKKSRAEDADLLKKVYNFPCLLIHNTSEIFDGEELFTGTFDSTWSILL